MKVLIDDVEQAVSNIRTAFNRGTNQQILKNLFTLKLDVTDAEGRTRTVTTLNYDNKFYYFNRFLDRKFMFDYAPEYKVMEVLIELWNGFIENNAENFNRMATAMYMEYNPLENFNGKIHTTTQDSGTEELEHGLTQTDSGSDTLAHGLKTTESGTDATTYSGGTENTKSGSMDLTKSGSEKNKLTKADETTLTSAFNNPNSLTPKSKTEYGSSGDENTTSFTNRKDTTSYNDYKDETKFTTDANGNSTRKDSTAFGHTVTDSGSDTTTYGKTTTNSGSDTTTFGKLVTYDEERHGNLGQTKSQEMLSDELEVRLVSITDYIIRLFLDRYTFY